MTEIIMKAYDVLDEILQDNKIHQLKALDQKIKIKYKFDIEAFHQLKEQYEAILKDGGAYHPDFKRVSKTFSLMKKTLYEKDEVTKYLQIEQALERELNILLYDISQTVSIYVPTSYLLGRFKKGGNYCAHESH